MAYEIYLKKGEEKVIEYIYANKEKDYENIVKKAVVKISIY